MIYAIADLHLPSALGKTMDQFGDQWIGHPEKIRRHWEECVRPEDSVLVCGDLSWGMRLEDVRQDLDFVSSLPGIKYLIRGNHDYWWSREATGKLRVQMPPGIVLLHGEGRIIEGVGVAGTRGWQMENDPPGPEESKIFSRELGYLRRALQSLPVGPRIAMLHYPPYDLDMSWNAFSQVLVEEQVQCVVFGHLHGGNPRVAQGNMKGVNLRLVAADQVDFTPQLIWPA